MSKTTLAHKSGYLDSHGEKILEMLNKGKPRKEIAEFFNISYDVLKQWTKKRDVMQTWNGNKIEFIFGKNSKSHCEQNKEQILIWKKAGVSNKEISTRLGYTTAHVVGNHMSRWKHEIS